MSQHEQSSKTISSIFEELSHALVGAAARPKKRVVHDLRNNTRRVKTAIEYRLPSGAGKAVERELKKVRQAAGAVRDVDVHKELVDSLESTKSTRARAFVRAKLDLIRARSEKRLIQLLSPKAVQELERALKQ